MSAPVLSVFSGGFDSTHAFFILSFVDPDRDGLRQININATDHQNAFTVEVAGSQAHLPGEQTHLDEARRITQAVFDAAFPHPHHERATS